MAKKKMLCPFSGELCRECPQYRGRHYYLCYCKEYRGYLGIPEHQTRQKVVRQSLDKKFRIPPVLTPSSTWLILNDFAERAEK
ncbi:MAG: hypothetical protein GTO16_03805 [Candidatus Aminicenantes bacterium]|nr:hypothetical protein [Candidatus Aminicenantes bacterium]